MPLVSIRSAEEASPTDRPVLDAGIAAYGQVLHTWGALLHSPGLFASYLPFLRQLNGAGELDQRTRDLTALRVAVLNHCVYTASHRTTAARANGATDEDLDAIAAGRFDRFDDRLRSALDLTDAMTLDPPRTRVAQAAEGVPADVRARASALFGEQELVELTMGIAIWNALSRFHRVMGFELDMPAPTPGVAAQL